MAKDLTTHKDLVLLNPLFSLKVLGKMIPQFSQSFTVATKLNCTMEHFSTGLSMDKARDSTLTESMKVHCFVIRRTDKAL